MKRKRRKTNWKRRTAMERTICRFIGRPPNAMYDVGVGHKSEWRTLNEEYPEMRLFGCEPNPSQFVRLKGTFPGVLFPVALGDVPGVANLYSPAQSTNPGAASLYDVSGSDPIATVSVWTLDRFDELAGSPERILLWMDIEGSELAALRGGVSLLRSGRIRWINLEVRSKPPAAMWPADHEIERFLEEFGYYKVQEYNDHQTHRDAIFVSFWELHS
jgi:FkbM family methyltransferase